VQEEPSPMIFVSPLLAPAPRPRILLLADDPDFLKLFKRLLKGGYELLEASDADSAFTELRHSRIDLVLVDLSRDANRAVRTISTAFPDLLIITLSENGNLEEMSEKVLMLPKPSRPSALVSFIAQSLERMTAESCATAASS
jgi:CheY-like chemotaxis protein